ncbi:two-component system LytT family sensor kinase/two-component system sensor histidine kinase LytS [Halanaerobium saccharolyticum]|uniref:histidine kinase n=1 Tax=Halanaerobium saccharolyticum TaxID=43595 RepID=A0A4R7ZBG9_9FIRM|nr:LytS/YhcK type 5TM receptor domain-containing protein [Halanaerobium saccharolyticum]RAK11825.1 two-component system LytT family sensor kinase/two-component system sensor histidine kinase LytS [Halanaerobium saccharolyticum]TDW07666.1 two-component system LytT family sensor kinase/two-component system sensor histidine kinase LytS [Halanaerobium saccharolyticum]TDX64587.1 two-component system LytT family sensor kinase/two-component system sensor histidine kinase LytS [Halanaerobium saccharolyt
MYNSRIFELLFTLFKSMSVIVTFAYILSRLSSVKHIFADNFNRYEKIFLTIFFAILSILGTFLGIFIMDAYANIRAIGALMGGILGGPLVGLTAGLIAGLHRFSLGGFTALACAIGTTSSGLIGGLFYKKYRNNEMDFKNGFLIGVFALTVEMIIVVLFSRPLAQAVELVKIIAIPMILSNSLGIAIFISILNKVKEDNQKIRALQAEKVLSIADRSLPLLQDGLDQEAAAEIIKMIKKESQVDSVSITNKETVLAFTGTGEDHHLAGEEIKTEASRRAIEEKKSILIDNKKEINCNHQGCQLTDAVITPLKIENSVYGLLKLYRCNQKITVLDIKLAEGISNLLATQIKLAKLSKQAELKSEAELKALQAQVNPHFLFNSLNAIAASCRTQPGQARELLIKLAGIFRRTLKRNVYQITLGEEIEFCQDYLSIEKARLDKRLQVKWKIPTELKDTIIPPFIIQPLVENSIKHGIYPQEKGGQIIVSAQKTGDQLQISIEDNGPGITEAKIAEIENGNNDRIGINNIKERLHSVYGSNADFKIKSAAGKGTQNIISIPSEFLFERRKAN